ncbi:WYL domain-containing protein [Herbivorax sp. ANBcel31]|uniref:WYL domain-containing protein n=1 Tax=Herbivorax sp. ANBcel31 TaxID=3069754 RepID=UPI0027B7A570|nr:WYL domain-containing protein [Herbivorax sp. ANBcel31]MDQ2085174.1 WYL domain-containing protein [Herbivorax sp. ANBcel31]
MELFNEVKNKYFQLVLKIVNECADGKGQRDILKLIDDGEFEQKVIGKNQKTFADIMLNRCNDDENLDLLNEKEGLFYPSFKNAGKPPIPIRFTKLEKAWLKALLEKDETRILLKSKTIEKLKKELSNDDSPIKDEYFEMTNTIKLPEINKTKTYEENFRTILAAIIKEKPIRYNNIDKNGNVYKNNLSVPVRIEYSMRDGRFRLSMYSINDNRPVMANIFTLSHVKMVDEKVNIDRETAKKLISEQKYSKEPVILEVTDKKKAMERCFMCFSGVERTARSLGNNKYEIRLNYYLFEEENLIKSIISLGPFVKVISPKKICDEIIKRVKKSIELYDEAF